MNKCYVLHNVQGRLAQACLLLLLSLVGLTDLLATSLPGQHDTGVSQVYAGSSIGFPATLQNGPVFGGTCEDRTLCIGDPGVSLPDNNQLLIGEQTPGSTSCSAHLTLDLPVTITCGDSVRYAVWLFPFDGPDSILLQATTSLGADSAGAAVLTFDTHTSPDPNIRANGIPYTANACADRHRLVWIATDDCGESSRCVSMIALVDCRPPVPVCISGPIVIYIPSSLQVTLWAKDFIVGGVDDCSTAEDLLFSLSASQYEPSRFMPCEVIPDLGVELPMPIWFADGGYDRNCDGEIDWDERNIDSCIVTRIFIDQTGACHAGYNPFIVSGRILTPKGDPVSQVTLNAETQVGPWANFITGADGTFGWQFGPYYTNVSVRAERNDNHKNGVSTLDLVKIQKHLLEIEPFTSPYQDIAADVNNSQSVSAIDMVELRKLILGKYTEFPANKSWLFFDAASVWPALKQQINIPVLDRDFTDQDFIGVKIGDVNGSVQPNFQQILPRGPRNAVQLSVADRAVRTGDHVEIRVLADDRMTLEGLQFTLDLPGLEGISVTPGLMEVNDDCVGLFPDRMTMSWFEVGGIHAAPGDLLFTLSCVATTDGLLRDMIRMNSAVTEAEAYDPAGEAYDIRLSFRSPDGTLLSQMPVLFQNEPNPVRSETRIGFWLPAEMDVRLRFFDITGHVILVKELPGREGYNAVPIARSELPASGLVYYRLETGSFAAARTMILVN